MAEEQNVLDRVRFLLAFDFASIQLMRMNCFKFCAVSSRVQRVSYRYRNLLLLLFFSFKVFSIHYLLIGLIEITHICSAVERREKTKLSSSSSSKTIILSTFHHLFPDFLYSFLLPHETHFSLFTFHTKSESIYTFTVANLLIVC